MSSVYNDIATEAMSRIFNRVPRGFQCFVIPHLLKMLSGSLPKQPVLMVQPTGAGKSSVPLTTAVVDGGVTLIIENTLSLGSDQHTKVSSCANSTSLRHIKSFHLDSFKNDEIELHLSQSILNHCCHNNNTSIIIFSSPEKLLKTVWIDFLLQCDSSKILNLICIDEIHLFVDFGCTFRTSFQLLNNKLFSKLRINNTTSTVPLLLMTATFNYPLLRLLEKMIGFKVTPPNIFWADIKSFQKRHINIKISYSMQHYNIMKQNVFNELKNNSTHKCIIITSTAKQACESQDTMDSWLNIDNKLVGDSVLVVGSRDTELKFAFTTAFTMCKFDAKIPNENNELKPRFLIGTSGCIGAGLDCKDVHFVFRMGIPTNLINFIQEMG